MTKVTEALKDFLLLRVTKVTEDYVWKDMSGGVGGCSGVGRENGY